MTESTNVATIPLALTGQRGRLIALNVMKATGIWIVLLPFLMVFYREEPLVLDVVVLTTAGNLFVGALLYRVLTGGVR